LFKFSKLKAFMALLAFCALIWVSPTPTFAATSSQIIMVLDGIRGESTNKSYRDGINISSFSFGASAGASDSSSGKAGKATYSDINVTKLVDTSSLPLLKNLATGRSIASGAIYFLNSSNQPYLVIRLTNILVDSLQLSGAESGSIAESVSLRSSKIQFEYTPIDSRGLPGPKQTLDIDIARNVAE
jgi:type VI secretion system secreted protein Hcp